mgnify:CR=1 FL=1
MTEGDDGKTEYVLAIYKDGEWEQNPTDSGTIATVPNGDSYRLTDNGLIRILDADDYKYFYDKIWSET